MAVNVAGTDGQARPRWPVAPFDPGLAYVDYGAVADELVVYFGGRPVPSFVDPIETPEGSAVGVLVGVDPGGEETGDVVGIHVYPLLVGAVAHHPRWARLAWAALAGWEHDGGMLREELPGFVTEVRELFERFWTPAPPAEDRPADLAARLSPLETVQEAR